MNEKTKRKNNHFILKLFAIIIFSISILFISNALEKNVVFADSGFDSSYDSGGSFDSGSGFDSGSSWDSDSSFDGEGGAEILIYFIIFAIYITIIIIKMCLNSKKSNNSNDILTKSDEAVVQKIKQYIPNFNCEEFLTQGYKIYLDVQNAWMNFNLEDVKDVISDEMFNMYQAQLDTLEVKGEQNIMKGFVNMNSYIKDVVNQNNNITITTCYIIEFYDYIINKVTGKVIRGTSTSKIRATYEMKFRKTLDDSLVIDKCPNCGAKIDKMNGAGRCEYCGSKVVSENAKWILTDKKMKGL